MIQTHLNTYYEKHTATPALEGRLSLIGKMKIYAKHFVSPATRWRPRTFP